jgi:hypothetical protein
LIKVSTPKEAKRRVYNSQGAVFKVCDFSGGNLSNPKLNRCIFERFNLSKCNLSNIATGLNYNFLQKKKKSIKKIYFISDKKHLLTVSNKKNQMH